ncbi:hypothetical protein KCP69_07910 [Salmonella enterica subsp. enterica]|nr:hypothetical protein KCP69_07910 [Salmonella enterica subsp. enterica]
MLHAFIHWQEKGRYKSAPHTLTVQQHSILAMNYACLWQKPGRVEATSRK